MTLSENPPMMLGDDREAKERILACARELIPPTVKGKRYEAITPTDYRLLDELLRQARYLTHSEIAEAVGCSRAKVGRALKALANAGLMVAAGILVRPRAGENSPWSKLTEEQIRNIRSDVGRGGASFAREYGVCGSVITSIRKGRTWRSVEAVRERAAELVDTGDPALTIIGVVAAAHEIPVAGVLGQSRFCEVVLARHEAMWKVRQECALSLPHIGRIFGGRDHTTVLYGIRKHQALLDSRAVP